MDDLKFTKESYDEIHIDVEESDSEILESYLAEDIAALPYEDCDSGLIYKVSEKYRKAKEESYTPRVVSIGPLHHGKSHLQPMEAYKLKCLTNLIKELRISLKTLSKYATTHEDLVCSYYQLKDCDFMFDDREFSKMILLDGIFIILLISSNQHFNECAVMLDQNAWMLSDIMHDMLLLENQLPLNFVMGLLDILVPEAISDSFYEDLRNYFQDVGITKRLKVNSKCKFASHLVDFLFRLHLPSEENQSLGYGRVKHTKSCSELQGVGVRFCPRVKGLFEITFDNKTGKLCIPQLTVNDTTETLFRNLIAFEQSRRQRKHITSYVILMDKLIDTAEDVKLLVENEIIVNSLGEDQLVADLFNNLHKEVIHVRDFYFTELCNELNNYSNCFRQWRSSCFKWMSMLKKKYFSNPWSVISLVAATVLLVLTIVQTVYAVKGFKK